MVKKQILALFLVVSIFGAIFFSSDILAQPEKDGKVRIIVSYKEDTIKERVVNIIKSYNADFIKEIEQGKLLVYSLPKSEFEMIKNDKRLSNLGVEIEQDHIFKATTYTPNDPYWPQWNMQLIDVDYTWDIVQGDQGVIVALLDTGVEYTHDDLKTNVDETLGWDYVNNDNDPWDDNDHGTYMAGIIVAEIDNNIGIAGISQVTLMPMKVLDSQGNGWTSDIVDAIYDAGNAGAKVISMSFGSYSWSSSLLNAVNWAYNNGIVLVAAAGNDGTSSHLYPAAYSNVIGVGAVNSLGQRMSWSNYGDNVEIMAPGNRVWSTKRGNSYGSVSGTSIATPHVAGAAALAFSARPTMTNVQFRNIMHNWADDMDSPGFDQYTGYGLLDLWGPID